MTLDTETGKLIAEGLAEADPTLAAEASELARKLAELEGKSDVE